MQRVQVQRSFIASFIESSFVVGQSDERIVAAGSRPVLKEQAGFLE